MTTLIIVMKRMVLSLIISSHFRHATRLVQPLASGQLSLQWWSLHIGECTFGDCGQRYCPNNYRFHRGAIYCHLSSFQVSGVPSSGCPSPWSSCPSHTAQFPFSLARTNWFSFRCRQHTMSKLSRAVKFIFAIWIAALLLALPQAIQFSVVVQGVGSSCTVWLMGGL